MKVWVICTGVSIHALLAESDIAGLITLNGTKVSIHALLAESDLLRHSAGCNCHSVSIHALLAESDALTLSTL